ncbi:hypothetical protein HDU82_001447 [Entophlyctis luteolus]|nr:hypothetical protein HDU82_001447 [Entophlyctis luteolus]
MLSTTATTSSKSTASTESSTLTTSPGSSFTDSLELTAVGAMTGMADMNKITETNGTMTITEETNNVIPNSSIALAVVGGLFALFGVIVWLVFRHKRIRERKSHSGDNLEWISHASGFASLPKGGKSEYRPSLDDEQLMEKIMRVGGGYSDNVVCATVGGGQQYVENNGYYLHPEALIE